MLDEVDLAWDQGEPRRPSSGKKARQRREARRRRQRQRRVRSTINWLLVGVLCAVLGYGTYQGVGWAQDEFGPKDFAAADRTDEVVDVRVKPGFNGFQMGDALVDAGVVRTIEGFISAFDAGDGEEIQPGTWRLYKKMPAADVVAAMLNRDKCAENAAPPCRVVNTVTIPEGFITIQIYSRLEQITGVPADEFKAAAADPLALGVSPDWFAARPNGTPVLASVEGFLFPATYDFDGGMSATEILKVMVKTFNEVAEDMDFIAKAQALNITPYEVLIAASIVEAEAVFEVDYAKVARVLYNRAFKQAPRCDHCLGLDSAINYWLRITGRQAVDSSEILASDIEDLTNPYNTHRKAGFPPGAISNPGRKTMTGALEPAPPNNNVFFMSIDKEGHMAYAATDAEFCALFVTANKNGLDLDPPSGC